MLAHTETIPGVGSQPQTHSSSGRSTVAGTWFEDSAAV
jgi:hypothetical protein